MGPRAEGVSLDSVANLAFLARIVPLLIVLLIIAILFEVYKSDFERWATPLTDWLREREAWSWTIPFAILLVLSFPPLFGHEIVMLVVGVSQVQPTCFHPLDPRPLPLSQSMSKGNEPKCLHPWHAADSVVDVVDVSPGRGHWDRCGGSDRGRGAVLVSSSFADTVQASHTD